MSDLISRSALAEKIRSQQITLPKFRGGKIPPVFEGFLEAVLRAVSEEPDAERHGHWWTEREPDGRVYCFHCSCCDSDGHHTGILTKYDYCPNCGAKMDEED